MASPQPREVARPSLEEAVRCICWDLHMERRGLEGSVGPDDFQDGFRAGFAAGLARAREILRRYVSRQRTQA